MGETGSNLIRKITSAGVVTTFAGSTGGTTDGTGTAAQFINPRGIIYDAFSGNLFVAEASNRVRKVTLAGVVTLFAGAANGSGGETDGTGTGATLNSPNAITADASGNLYVTESGGNRIRKITAAGVVTTFAGSGTPGHADGTGTNATFSSPNGITIDGSGNLYIVENYSIIRKITPAGVVSTFAGSITGGLNDGTGSAAQFAGASGITADAAGNLYVSENSNRIRKITTAAVVTTIAGSTAGGSTNGFGVAAKFQTPGGMAVDASGDLFVADFSNNVIRKVQTSSPFIIDSYIWSNGASGESVSVTDANVYTVKTVTGTCTSASDAGVTVTVTQPQATPTVSIAGTLAFCSGSSVVFTSSAATGNVWNTGATTQSITVTTTGNYSVKVINGPCTTSSSLVNAVAVSQTPAKPTVTVTGATTFCAGGSVTLTSSASAGILWSNGATSKTISVSATGTYSVQTITGTCSSLASTVTTVTVQQCVNTWLGGSTDWTDAGNWSAGTVPVATDVVVIAATAHNPLITGTANAKNLTINTGAALTLSGTLSLTGNLANNGTVSGSGTLALAGSTVQNISVNDFNIGNLSLNNAAGASIGCNLGITKVLNLVSGTLNTNGKLILRSSVAGTALADDFSSGNTGTINGLVTVERYVSTSGTHVVGTAASGQSVTALSSTCTLLSALDETVNLWKGLPGSCTATAFPIGSTFSLTAPAGTGFVFTGALTIVRGATGSGRGYNAIANPYASPISWAAVGAVSGNGSICSGVAYIWNPTLALWGTVTTTGLTAGGATDLIQSGQGFTVRRSTIGTTGGITFNQSVRRNTTQAQFMRKPSLAQVLRLSLTAENGRFDDVLLYNHPDAQAGTDDLDAEKMFSPEAVPSLTTGTDDLAINALPSNFEGSVPLNVSVPETGVYSLAVSEMAGVSVTLEDKKTGSFTALNSGTSVNALLSGGGEGNRFVLHYGSSKQSNQGIQIFAAEKTVTVLLPSSGLARIEAVNTLGQTTYSSEATGQTTQFSLPADGVYIIKVTRPEGTATGKLVY